MLLDGNGSGGRVWGLLQEGFQGRVRTAGERPDRLSGDGVAGRRVGDVETGARGEDVAPGGRLGRQEYTYVY